MSIIGEILDELWNTQLSYKGMRVNILGVPNFKKYPRRNLQKILNRLADRELIQKDMEGILLTPQGRKYMQKKQDALKVFEVSGNSKGPKNLLVIFDIPNERKAEREWFRWHLKKFGFIMIQRSVWAGPSPLPKGFKDYVKEIELENCIKTFKLAKGF